MREVLDELVGWWAAGQSAGMATVVDTWRSAPRPAGATMLVGPDGTAVGSVSGGCVEGALYEVAAEVRETGVPAARRYGVSDDDAFAAGLTCGGMLDVYVERIAPDTFPQLGEVAAAVRNGTPVAVLTVVADRCAGVDFTPDGTVPDEAAGRPDGVAPDGGRADGPDGDASPDGGHAGAPGGRVGRRMVVWEGRRDGSLGCARLDDAAADDSRGLLAAGRTGTIRYGHDGQRRGDDLRVFVAAYAPRPRMIVFGAIDFAAAVARVGSFLGYRVTVCDAREVFATARRFPDADEVVVDWPHRYLAAQAQAGAVDGRTVVCVLTHDPKFDVPVLEVALRLPLAYVGAMGSRRTHDDRMARLRAAGLTDAELSRLSSPVGLDIGARTPEETAVSVAAEIVAARWGGTGERLSERTESIHHDTGGRPSNRTKPPGQDTGERSSGRTGPAPRGAGSGH